MAVDWIIIAREDLEDYIADSVLSAFSTKALASGQTDPFDRHMPDVAKRIRAEIARHQTISETENAIPPSLKWVACPLILEQMQARLPGVELLEGLEEILRDAKKYLERINKGDVQVEEPTDPMEPSEIQATSAIEVAQSTTRVATRTYLAGL